MVSENEAAPGPERFYGRRRGKKLRPNRQGLMETLLPRLAVSWETAAGRLDPAALFPRPMAGTWLEIGFGGGEHLAAQAAAHPEIGLIGCEPFVNGVASLLGHVRAGALENVRIHHEDARPLLDALPEASIGRAFLLFPDPWPKARHAQRRFVGPENIERLARVLADGAEWRIASDDMGYIRWTLEQVPVHPAFTWAVEGPADWWERPADWPATRYEMKAISQGRRPVFLRFRRNPRVARP